MALGGEFLAKIRLALEGKSPVISGLQETRKEAQKLAATKITTTYDKEGLATGKQIQETFKNIGTEAKKSTPITQQFTKAIKRVAIVLPVWAATRVIIQSVTKLISDQIRFLTEFEDAMTRIKIVGKGTKEEYKRLEIAILGIGEAYGVAAQDAAKAAKIFAQQGRNVQETILLTRAAAIGAAVLGTDIETTVNNLTSAIEGFNIPISKAASIIDKWINVEKNFAVTAQDLANATKRVGATANQLGISMSAMLGDVTAIVEVTRKTGQEAATGLQFLYARLLTTAKPVIEQLAKIPFYLDKQGKSTFALTGTLRNATDILDDLSKKWGTLSKEEQLNIAVSLGSKRQLVTVNALMQNYSRSIDARITAITSAGEAEKAFALVQDTVSFKLKQVSTSWNALTYALADTSTWKASLDILQQYLLAITSLVSMSKAVAIATQRESASMLTTIETRQGELESLEELLRLRDKLSKEPSSDKTIERLKKVTNAIDKISKQHPTLEVIMKEGNEEDLKNKINKLINIEELKKINLTLVVQYQEQFQELIEKKKDLEDQLTLATPFTVEGKQVVKEIAEIDKQINDLNKKQREESEKLYAISQARKIDKELILDINEEELNLTEQLTAKEKEELNIERQLLNLRFSRESTSEQLIQKEIDLVRSSQNIYNIHEKTLKLEKLQNDLIQDRLKKKAEEQKTVEDLVLQYEKANELQRPQIRRVAELSVMTPEEVLSQFKSTPFDKNLILDNISTFTGEVQDAIKSYLRELRGFPKTDLGLQTDLGVGGAYAGVAATRPIDVANNYDINISLAGAITDENIQELLNKIDKKMKEQPNYIGDTNLKDILKQLASDDEAQKKLAKTLRPKI
jgi:TP901 family phage tail tape measure protein